MNSARRADLRRKQNRMQRHKEVEKSGQKRREVADKKAALR